MKNPLVSICCITYNHAQFIRKTLDGFLMQEPPTGVSIDEPWYEILIHDDASTDGTTEIIKEYAAKFPDKIFPLYETENQYKKGMAGKMEMYNYKRARGKYIAYCEGDDYWTYPLKLQKQVDFMEQHPDYSICMHGFSVHDIYTDQTCLSKDFTAYEASENRTPQGVDFTAKDFFEGNYGQPLTMLFRVIYFNLDWCNQYKHYRDTHELYHLLRAGKGYWMNFNGGVYNKHNGGVSTSTTMDNSVIEEREHILELYLNNKNDKVLADRLIEILLWNHSVYKREKRPMEFHRMMFKFLRLVPKVYFRTYGVIVRRNIKEIINR